MNQTLFTSLQGRLEDLQQQYQLHFAGMMRATRDQAMIQQMIESVEIIEDEVKSAPINGGAIIRQDLMDLCTERLELYRSELEAIQEARADLGADGVEAVGLGAEANSVFHRYRRHFSGQSRTTRDLGLLQEMLDDLHGIDDRLGVLYDKVGEESIQADRGVIAEYLVLMGGERDEIRTARDEGTLDNRADMLAEVANGQFALYEKLFAGQDRVSRRPELIQRMIGQLQTVQARMEGLQEVGLHTSKNRDNIEIVRERLESWETELEAIQQARQATPLLSMVDALGVAVDVVMEGYGEHFAGQSREGRDLALLDSLCTAMGELVRQMRTLSRVREMSANEQNLAMASDLLHMLETEWDEIAKLQEAPGAPE